VVKKEIFIISASHRFAIRNVSGLYYGSIEMLKLAKQAVTATAVDDQVELLHGYIPGVELEQHSYDAVVCKDTNQWLME
jgi:hypothetical protein